MSWVIVTQCELSFGISFSFLEAVIPVNFARQRTECDLWIHTWVPTPAQPLHNFVDLKSHLIFVTCKIGKTVPQGDVWGLKQSTWSPWTTVTMISLWDLGFPGGTSGEEPSCQRKRHETRVQSLGQADALEKGMATHSSILAWRIPWTEEPGKLQSMGSHRDLAPTHGHKFEPKEKKMLTQVLKLGYSDDNPPQSTLDVLVS